MKVNIGKYPEGEEKRKISVKIESWDTYSLYYTLALVILPSLKEFRSHQKGCPGCFAPVDENKSITDGMDEWNKVLDKMILGFEAILEDKAFDNSGRIEEGLELFAKYYMALWW